MNKSFVAIALVVAALCAAAPAIAQSDDRVVEIWTCTVNDGKTIEDVKPINSKWVELQNATVEGGDINSYVVTSVVGMSGTFLYIDTFPGMDAWVAAKEVMKSDAGKALNKEFDEVADCSSNTLHNSTES